MKKIHTRAKRKWGLSTHLSHYRFFHPKPNKNRPKTFKTEEAANARALKNGLKTEEYYLKKVKHENKFQIVMRNGKDKNTANKKNNP